MVLMELHDKKLDNLSIAGWLDKCTTVNATVVLKDKNEILPENIWRDIEAVSFFPVYEKEEPWYNAQGRPACKFVHIPYRYTNLTTNPIVKMDEINGEKAFYVLNQMSAYIKKGVLHCTKCISFKDKNGDEIVGDIHFQLIFSNHEWVIRKQTPVYEGSYGEFDIAVFVRDGVTGLSKKETISLYEILNKDSAYPIEIYSSKYESSAIGLITTSVAKELDYESH